MSKPFAVLVVITDHFDNGCVHERKYIRPSGSRMGKQAFAAYALGDLLMLLELEGKPISFTIEEIEV